MVKFNNKRRIDLTGSKFGRLTAISPGPDTRRKSGRLDNSWVCRCDCGNIVTVLTSNLGGNTKSCGCLNFDTRSKRFKGNKYSYNLQRKGTKNIKQTYFNSLKRNAIRGHKEFNITIDYMQELLESQMFKCALSGEDIIMDPYNTKKRFGVGNLNTASLDRIDSSKGYTIENVQWIHKDVNRMKSDYPQQEFISWCKKIANKNIS